MMPSRTQATLSISVYLILTSYLYCCCLLVARWLLQSRRYIFFFTLSFNTLKNTEHVVLWSCSHVGCNCFVDIKLRKIELRKQRVIYWTIWISTLLCFFLTPANLSFIFFQSLLLPGRWDLFCLNHEWPLNFVKFLFLHWLRCYES